jgi:hypothetical protein
MNNADFPWNYGINPPAGCFIDHAVPRRKEVALNMETNPVQAHYVLLSALCPAPKNLVRLRVRVTVERTELITIAAQGDGIKVPFIENPVDIRSFPMGPVEPTRTAHAYADNQMLHQILTNNRDQTESSRILLYIWEVKA